MLLRYQVVCIVILAAAVSALPASNEGNADILRARQVVPGEHVKGFGAEDSAAKMNSVHEKNLPPNVNATPCDLWTLPELTDLLEAFPTERKD